MTSRELWQTVLDKTNKEIVSGRYQVKFSQFEVFIFPKPNGAQKFSLRYLAPLYRQIKRLFIRCLFFNQSTQSV